MSSLIQSFRQTFGTAAFVIACGTTFGEAAEPKVRLNAQTQIGKLTQVEAILEVAGKLKLNPDGKQVIHLPLTGKSELQYLEKLTSDGRSAIPRRSVRYYQIAHAASRVGERDVTSQLSEKRRLIAVESSAADAALFSPVGPLSRDELELIDIQSNTLLLDRLLPEKDIAIGEKWSHDDTLAAALFNLDVVLENKLESTLVRIDGRVAMLELAGTVDGSVAGVADRIDVTAKYSFDLDQRQISWMAMSLKENRSVGHAEPGLEVIARLRVSIKQGSSREELSDEALAQLPQDMHAASTLLAFSSQANGIRFLHDRGWNVMVDRNDVLILRLVERGELIAQCNISRLPDAAAGKQLSMTTFQSDIRRVLDRNFGQFADSGDTITNRGLRMLRSIVAGIAADLPIQWNYYHLTDGEGHQASLVFTVDAKLVDRLAIADQTIVGSFEFLGNELSNTANRQAPDGASREAKGTVGSSPNAATTSR